VKNAGYPIYIVLGNKKNIKITTEDDILFSEFIIRSVKDEGNL
jgi:2-C-methyl-D-erythritol 4-phosphate cytidylyltransferase